MRKIKHRRHRHLGAEIMITVTFQKKRHCPHASDSEKTKFGIDPTGVPSSGERTLNVLGHWTSCPPTVREKISTISSPHCKTRKIIDNNVESCFRQQNARLRLKTQAAFSTLISIRKWKHTDIDKNSELKSGTTRPQSWSTTSPISRILSR